MTLGVFGGMLRCTRFRVAVALAISGWMAGCGDDEGTRAERPNAEPVLAPQPDTSAAIGDTLLLQALGTDADDDPIAYLLVIEVTFEEIHDGYIPSAALGRDTGRFWFAPQDRDRPRRRFHFVADDGRGGRDSTAFAVAVM